MTSNKLLTSTAALWFILHLGFFILISFILRLLKWYCHVGAL